MTNADPTPTEPTTDNDGALVWPTDGDYSPDDFGQDYTPVPADDDYSPDPSDERSDND